MDREPTPFPELNEVLSEFVGGVRSILGDDLVGACLQGSFAVGDADEHSDCDWVIAVARPMTDDQVAALQNDFYRFYDLPSPWANRFYQGYITLGFCRKWCDLTLGTVGSKRRGAAWAKERLDPEWHDLIDRAWATRPVPEVQVKTPADPEDWARTLRLLALIVERVRI